jgi:acyl-CoA thioesterase FadM
MLTLLERARWAALEKNMRFEDYIRRSQWAVVRHVDVSYSNPALPGDDFIVRTGLMKIGNTSFSVKQVARNQKGDLICEAEIVYVTLSAEGKPMPVPEEWRSIFTEWTD